ncbi:hypothetical protein QJS10_CPB11g00654 [Acorus calamus]|uniref:F-box protein n=1 Tax=Acorus calamus TaxID=4465 RepID=A0AAV9DTD1_ACOCL|nr:hypothetical protein QJS10_CPB11g00654 [Acorus calamus]
MERLPTELLSLNIFCLLDHHSLATSIQVCRKWKGLASEDVLWQNLFKKRWGEESASFYAPVDGVKTWKQVYEVQDRCDRIGVGLRITREGEDYYLVHQGEIQSYLGRRKCRDNECGGGIERGVLAEEDKEKPRSGILDKILFFIGDLEVASRV